MGDIRKQTIYSSVVIYIGFIIGFVNTYLYVKNGTFTSEQYGLTRLINDLGITFFSFATFGIIAFIYKFFPYYKHNLSKEENDQLGFSLVVVTIGFIVVATGLVMLKPLFVRKFTERSALFIQYYYWLLPFMGGVLYFTVFEAFAWFGQRSIISNLLKETGFRVGQLVLILLFLFRSISFSLFVKLFACLYALLAIVLVWYLYRRRIIHFNFKISRVTRKYRKKIITLMSLIYGSLIINTIAQYISAIVIASVSTHGLADVGVFTFASFVASTILVPQKSIVAAAIPVLSSSWRNKDMNEIGRIYSRTSINLLLVGMFIFFIIWLNFDDVFHVLNINKDFRAGKLVILLLGTRAIIDAGTGVNSQIIGTSNYWRFEVLTSVLLFALAIPLNYFLVKRYGINGSAVSDLIAYTVYNAVRFTFIWRKFGLQPFSFKTIVAIVVALALYFGCFYLFDNMHNWLGIIIRSLVFAGLFMGAVFAFRLTPDAHQLWDLALVKLGRKKQSA